MKTYLSNLIPQLRSFSKKLDNITLLTSKHWVVIDENNNIKTVYIFRQNNELIISTNGKVSKNKWDYLGHDSLLIDTSDGSYLFRHGFFDENVLVLKIDNAPEYAYLVDETDYQKELKSTSKIDEFLKRKYLLTDASKLVNVRNETQFKSLNQNTYSTSNSSSANTNNYRVNEVVQTKVKKQLTKEEVEKREKSDRIWRILFELMPVIIFLLLIFFAYLIRYMRFGRLW